MIHIRFIPLAMLIASTAFAGNAVPIPVSPFPACSAIKAWEKMNDLPAVWRTQFNASMRRPRALPREVSVVWRLRLKENGTAKRKFFLSQWIGSLLLKANLPLEAFQVYQENVQNYVNESNKAALLENIECIGEIKSRFPSLEFNAATVGALRKLSPSLKRQSDLNILGRVLYLSELDSFSQKTGDSLSKSPEPIENVPDFSAKLLQAMRESYSGNGKQALALIKPIEAAPSLAQSAFSNDIHLLAGQLSYSAGEFSASLASWARVRPESNFFAEAVRGISWAYLSMERYSSAVGSSYNLLVGPLHQTFQPDAFLIVAIAMNETCDYPRAMETIRTYKHAYGKTHAWLINWEKEKLKIYSQVINFLRSESDVPLRIGLEWARNPIFLSHQNEINELLRERVILSGAQKNAQKNDAFQAFLAAQTEKSLLREKQLVQGTNEALEAETIRMRMTLEKISDEMQLVQAEVLSSVGEKMILDQAGLETSSAKNVKGKESKQSNSTWDWGTFSPDAEDGGEFWNDELGFLKADVNNKCLR